MSVKNRASSKLFTPLPLADGTVTLKHRMYIFLISNPLFLPFEVYGEGFEIDIDCSVMAPLTRLRSPNHVPTDLVGEYYEQRASDGGLLISEGTLISPMVCQTLRLRVYTHTIGGWLSQCPWNLD